MAEARGRDAWNHTSTLLAMIANVNRDPKKTPAFQPAHFDPYRARSPARVGRLPAKAGFEMLKAVFIDSAGGQRP